MYDVMTEGLTNPSRLSRLMGAKENLSYRDLAADRKRIAKAINSATGRGNLGVKGNQAAPLLNIGMFSPRLLKSRVELLNNMFNPVAWKNMPRNARAQILQDNVKFLTATVAVMSLAKAAGGTVNTDPDDGDFLKIRFGDTTYDTLTGLQQPLRYILNMQDALSGDELRLAGAVTSGFGLVPNRVSESLRTRGERRNELYAGKSKAELTGRFVRSKLAPLAGTATDYLTGEDFSGRQFSPRRAAVEAITPLPAKDIIDAFRQGGLLAAVKTVPTFMGVGVNTYPVSPDKPTTHAEKLARKIVRDSMGDKTRTDEEIDKSKVISSLRARSRQGEDVSAEAQKAGASERQLKVIKEAKGQSRLEEDVKGMSIEDAIRVYRAGDRGEQQRLKPVLVEKAENVDQMDEERQARVVALMAAIGMKPTDVAVRKAREPRTVRSRSPRQHFAFQ